MSKLVLGTVQFGVNYGINNTEGQVPLMEVCEILKIAKKNEIETLDTSSGYGESERVLGMAMKSSGTQFKIVSKYPRSIKTVADSFIDSISNLGVDHLYGYLVHHFDFYLEKPSQFDEMRHLKETGKIEKIGFSLYSVKELEYLMNNNVEFDILQFPYNIFDRQFEPYMQMLVEKGVEIHTRSAFLQGLFFRNPESLPDKIKPLRPYLEVLHAYCKEKGVSIEQLSLGYVINNPYVKGNLIGVDNHHQLVNNIEVSKKQLKEEDINFIKSISVKEKDLLSPVNWN